MKKAILLNWLLAGTVVHSWSQSTTPFIFNSAGGSYNNAASYYRFEWSIGEMTMIATLNSPDSAVRMLHGVLQPGTEKISYPLTLLFEKGDYKLFPNPTTGPLELNFFVPHTGKMELLLTDAVGRTLESRIYSYDGVRRIQFFDLSRYPNGAYYIMATLTPDINRPLDNLKVIRRSGFKVIKLK